MRMLDERTKATLESKANDFIKKATGKAFSYVDEHTVRTAIVEWEANKVGMTMYQSRVIDANAVADKRHEQNRRRAELAALKEKTAAAWAQDNLKPGMVVIMKGTRDSTGFRYVVSIDRTTVHCRKVVRAASRLSGVVYFQYHDSMVLGLLPEMTSHHIGKLKSYLDPVTTKWVEVDKVSKDD